MTSNVLKFTGSARTSKALQAVYTRLDGLLSPLPIDPVLSAGYDANLKMAFVRISPDEAKTILENTSDEGQRDVSDPVVRLYANSVRMGVWKALNPQPIIFSDKWDLMDGRHRLTMTVRTGKPLDTVMVWGVPASVFDTIDIGKKRNPKDIGSIRGEQYSTVITAAISLQIRYDNKTMRRCERPTNPEIDAFLQLPECDPMRDSVAFIKSKKMRGISKIMPESMAVFIHYNASYIHQGLANDFLEKIKTGEMLRDGHPVSTLREFLFRNKAAGRKSKIDAQGVIARCINAWNAFALDQDMRRIKGETARIDRSDNFPQFYDPDAEDARWSVKFGNSGWRKTVERTSAIAFGG